MLAWGEGRAPPCWSGGSLAAEARRTEKFGEFLDASNKVSGPRQTEVGIHVHAPPTVCLAAAGNTRSLSSLAPHRNPRGKHSEVHLGGHSALRYVGVRLQMPPRQAFAPGDPFPSRSTTSTNVRWSERGAATTSRDSEQRHRPSLSLLSGSFPQK